MRCPRPARPAFSAILPSLLLVLSTGAFLPALARNERPDVGSGTGVIRGIVFDLGGAPIAFASVRLLDLEWGAATSEDGTFEIPRLPAGTYSIRVTHSGYAEQTLHDVTLRTGQVETLDFHLEARPFELPAVEIFAKPPVIDDRSDSRRFVSGGEIENLPVGSIEEKLAMTPGVVARNGELHIRGGRDPELKVEIDGMSARDPLGGTRASLAPLAVENTEMILGGFDAQHGGLQSGLINFKTKEGSEEFAADLYYMTDDYGQPDNTFDNLDRVFIGAGGPSPIRDLTYYVSAEGTYQDDYPATPRRRHRHRLLNFISLGERKSNSLRVQSKLAFKPGPNYKLTAELINNESRSDQYFHEWSRVGYVQTFRDTTQTGEVVVRHGRFSESKLDDSYEYYNAAEHTPDFLDTFNQWKLVWSHTLDATAFYTVKLSRNVFLADQRVGGKEAWEYEGARERDFWFNYTDNVAGEFFVLSGDFPVLANRDTRAYLAKADVTKRLEGHTLQSGVDFAYHDMRFFQMDRPYLTNGNGEIGGTRTRYHYFSPEGAAYVQDRWEHEGMVLNAGLRYDVFSVGDQLPISEIGERVKHQFSPRVGIAYPISDRDVFSFHYGRFYQIPDRRFLFDDRDAFDGRPRGNPNLSNETTVSYQAGIQHLFNEWVSGQFAVYYKDIFGLVSAEARTAFGSVGTVTQFVNRDYASARGFEATLSRRLKNRFSGEINYGFGLATGVASDPTALTEQPFAYLPISEQPLDWDVRHTLRVQCSLVQPAAWSTSFIWQYESGFPTTPYDRDTRALAPEVINSRRLPGTTSLDVQAEKHYEIWGQRLKLFLQGRNVLDAKNITALAPANWPLPPGRTDQEYLVYYTETGRAGGAYLGEDRTGDGIGDWVALRDPRVFGDPRSVRMGLQFKF